MPPPRPRRSSAIRAHLAEARPAAVARGSRVLRRSRARRARKGCGCARPSSPRRRSRRCARARNRRRKSRAKVRDRPDRRGARRATARSRCRCVPAGSRPKDRQRRFRFPPGQACGGRRRARRSWRCDWGFRRHGAKFRPAPPVASLARLDPAVLPRLPRPTVTRRLDECTSGVGAMPHKKFHLIFSPLPRGLCLLCYDAAAAADPTKFQSYGNKNSPPQGCHSRACKKGKFRTPP